MAETVRASKLVMDMNGKKDTGVLALIVPCGTIIPFQFIVESVANEECEFYAIVSFDDAVIKADDVMKSDDFDISKLIYVSLQM